MPLYAYTARDQDGGFVAGSLSCDDLSMAIEHLRARALFVTALEPARSGRGALATLFAFLPVRAESRLACFRSLATLVHAGVPLRRALQVTIDECADHRLKEALRSVASDIEAGSALSVAMSRRPREFSDLSIAMVRAGELAGVIDEVLERIASLLERDSAMRKRLHAALAYPAIVAAAAIALVLFLIANIVPAFAGLFAQMHVALPPSTRIIIAIGIALGHPAAAILVPLVAFTAVGIVRVAWRQERCGRHLDRTLFSAPIVGKLAQKATVATLARTLGTLLKSGVALLVALEATERAVGHILYRDALRAVAERLREGLPFAEPLEKSALFDALFLQLVRVGEETGALDAMLLRIADYLELDVETAMATIGSIIEPVMIVFLGVVVGTIVASILLPLYSIIGSIK